MNRISILLWFERFRAINTLSISTIESMPEPIKEKVLESYPIGLFEEKANSTYYKDVLSLVTDFLEEENISKNIYVEINSMIDSITIKRDYIVGIYNSILVKDLPDTLRTIKAYKDNEFVGLGSIKLSELLDNRYPDILDVNKLTLSETDKRIVLDRYPDITVMKFIPLLVTIHIVDIDLILKSLHEYRDSLIGNMFTPIPDAMNDSIYDTVAMPQFIQLYDIARDIIDVSN